MLKNSIPFAVDLRPTLQMPERGNYPDGYAQGPRGLVVHFTAGRFEKGWQNAVQTIKHGIRDGYTFLCIATTGELAQAHDIFKWGRHAGESAWRWVFKKLKLVGGVSDDLIGVEMNSAGKLTRERLGPQGEWKFYPYWCYKNYDPSADLIDPNGNIPVTQVRFVTQTDYGCPTGYYHRYTPEQELKLIKLIYYLYQFPSFKLEYVLGHHEVSGILGIGRFRKPDPGGALSLPMPWFRSFLQHHKRSSEAVWIEAFKKLTNNHTSWVGVEDAIKYHGLVKPADLV